LKIHPNDFALEELLLSLSKEHLGVVDHLLRCSTCRRRFLGFLQHQRSGPLARRAADVLKWTTVPVSYGGVLRESEHVFVEKERVIAKERVDAPGLFVELTRYPADQRDFVLKNSSRFHTWGVFELLVERTSEISIRNPFQAEELGTLALRLSEYLDPNLYGAELIEDLKARAWAYLGNAYRVRSDLQAAQAAFGSAYEHLKKGTSDILERAVLFDLEASLRRDQRDFDDALSLLRRAIAIFLQYGQQHRAGRSLLKTHDVHHHMGNSEKGIPLLYQALDLIDPEQEPRLLLCARHNLILSLTETGRHLEAQGLYRATRPLYRSFPDAWTQNRRKWVKGKIARGLGQADQAESLFLAARDGFVQEGVPYDTALVSMELATLYAEQGRRSDLRRLAEGMVPIFSSLNIHREALAALACLKQAAEVDRATVELVSSVATYLRRAQHDPGMRFLEGWE
jgi:tetratricopeptide (TPR) repeat protein